MWNPRMEVLLATQALQPVKMTPPALGFSPDDLVRLIVETMSAVVPEGCAKPVDGQEEILLDLDVDGARYLLIRLPVEERAWSNLSPREQEIVRLVAQGHSNKIIAGVLSISTWTVCTHVRRIFAKLGVQTRAAMVARIPNRGPRASQTANTRS